MGTPMPKGCFAYLIQPDRVARPCRVKVGKSVNPYSRLEALRTFCPESRLLAVYDVLSGDGGYGERKLSDFLVDACGCKRSGREVFDSGNIYDLMRKIRQTRSRPLDGMRLISKFAILPQAKHRGRYKPRKRILSVLPGDRAEAARLGLTVPYFIRRYACGRSSSYEADRIAYLDSILAASRGR
jgi:hypothetical protein